MWLATSVADPFHQASRKRIGDSPDLVRAEFLRAVAIMRRANCGPVFIKGSERPRSADAWFGKG